MCKFSVDGRAKGEGSDSISRCPELTFTPILECSAIGSVASTVDPVTTLRLVLDLCLGIHTPTHTTCICTHTQTHTHTHTMHTHTHHHTLHTHNKQGPSLSGRTSRTFALIRSLFHGSSERAFKMAAIENDSGTKTATDGALFGKILRTMLICAQLATQRQCEILLRESRFQKMPGIKYLARSTLPIPEPHKCKYNYYRNI